MSENFTTYSQTSITNNQYPTQRKKKVDNFSKKRGKNGNKFYFTPNSDQNSLEPANKVTLHVNNKMNFNCNPKPQYANLILSGKVKSIEDIYLQNIKIVEEEIIDHLLGTSNLKEEIFGIKPVIYNNSKGSVQKAFKVIVVIGDHNGHIGIGIKTSNEIANAIRDAKKMAKLSTIPVIRGSWKSNDRNLHTVISPIIGNYKNIEMKLMPAPNGTGIVACSVAKKLLEMSGFKDIYASSTGHAKSTYDYLIATYEAIHSTFYSRLNVRSKRESIKNTSCLINAPSSQKFSPCKNMGVSQDNLRLTSEVII